MIKVGSMLVVADNSGAKKVQCIHLFGGTNRGYASLGDVIKVSIKKTNRREGSIKKGTVSHAVILRTVKEVRRKDGSYIRFDKNAVALISMVNNEPKLRGSRILGPVARELKGGYPKIVSLASAAL